MKVSVPRLAALAGLQFLAALHILFFYDAASHFEMAAPLARFVSAGWTSFSLLFVLTGFLTAYNWIDPTGKRVFGRGAFWSARFARVYPLYAIALVLALVPVYERLARTEFAKPALFKTALELFASGALVQAWSPQTACSINCPGWAVSDAAFFFVLFPLFVPLLMMLRGRTLLIASAGLWIVSLGAAFIAQDVVTSVVLGGAKRIPPLWLDGLAMNPLLRLPEFLIGALLGRYFLDAKHDPSWHSYATPIAVASAVILLGVMVAGPVFPVILHRTSLLVPVEGALIFSLAALSLRYGSPLASRTLVTLGQIGFAVFILQHPLHELLRMGAVLAGLYLHRSPSWMLAYLVTVLVTAALATMLIAEPVRNRILLLLVPPRFRKSIPLIIGQRHTIDAMEGEGTWDQEREAEKRISRTVEREAAWRDER